MSGAKSDTSELVTIDVGVGFSGCGGFGILGGDMAECALLFRPTPLRF